MNSSHASICIRIFQLLVASTALALGSVILVGASFTVDPAMLTIVSAIITLVFASITLIPSPTTLVLPISVVEFIVLVLWIATTAYSGYYFGDADCTGVDVLFFSYFASWDFTSCKVGKGTIGISAVQVLLHLVTLLLQVVYVHIPAWKQGSTPRYSRGMVFAEQPFGGHDTFVAVPETGEAPPEYVRKIV